MSEKKLDYLNTRLAHLKAMRMPWEALWDKCAELCANDSRIYTFNAQGKLKQNLFDTTAVNALQTFTASLKSIICPTNARYHRLKATNPKLQNDDRIRKYIEYANDLCFKFRYAAGSGFSSEADLLFNSLGIVGHRAWLVEDGSVDSFIGICKNKNTIEQIADFNGDGIDDLRIRAGADIGVLYVNGADDTTWQYFKSVGTEWDTSFAALA